MTLLCSRVRRKSAGVVSLAGTNLPLRDPVSLAGMMLPLWDPVALAGMVHLCPGFSSSSFLGW